MESETVISISFGAILAVFSFAIVVYSFVRDRQPSSVSNAALAVSDDQALADIFDAINTLDLEFQLGRLPQEQYQEQYQAYRVQAAKALRDQLQAGRGDPAWVLEQEILLARGAQESSDGRIIACPDCSAAVLGSATNCPHCAAEMVSQP